MGAPALRKDAATARLKQLKHGARRRDIVLKRTAPKRTGFEADKEAAVISETRMLEEVRSVGPDAVLRPATPDDCRRIAELFRVSSDGVADYIWSQLQPAHPGASLVEIGARRYQRENTAFSYQNCLVAEHRGEVIGMMHAFVIEPHDGSAPAREVDPVLRPYAELEEPGSLYISSLAVVPRHRGQGLGRRFLAAARERARRLGCPSLSLICLDRNEGAKRLYEREGFTTIGRRDVVPHPLIHATGTALLMTSPVQPGHGAGSTSCNI